MKIIASKLPYLFDISIKEIRLIHQAINEVCYGLKVVDFNATIGSRAFAIKTLERLGRVYEENTKVRNSRINLILTPDDVQLFCNALAEVLKQIDDWEFDTRMGAERAMAVLLLNQLQAAS